MTCNNCNNEMEIQYVCEQCGNRKACMEVETLKSALTKAMDTLEDIINCPHSIDRATIPKDGISANPEQVVCNYSVGLLRVKKARDTITQIKSLLGDE